MTRQEAAQATRQKLLETTGRLVCDRGFDNVSVDDIVTACGVARGTFYVYFRNKADAVRQYARLPFVRLEQRVMQKGDPVLERLRCYIREFTSSLIEYGLPITQQWVREVADPRSAPASTDNGKLNDDLTVLVRLLESGIEQGELEAHMPVQRLAELITCQLYGQMTCWCMSSGRLDMQAAADTYCREVLPGLLAPYHLVKDHGGTND